MRITLPRLALISLAVFGDLVRILPKSKGQAWNFWFGSQSPSEQFFHRQSFINAASRLLVTEQIERVVKDGRVLIKISAKGHRILSAQLNLEKFSRGVWDRKWRLAVFDVDEKFRKQRDRIRNKLKDLGFGMLQESVWVSPFPLEEELNDFFSGWSVRGEVLVIRAEILVGDQKDLAQRVWSLNRFNEDYLELVTQWRELSPGEKSKEKAFVFQSRYFDLLWDDPFLPKELLPNEWFGGLVAKLYRREVRPLLLS